MEIPSEVTKKLCQAERFCLGLKQVMLECGMKNFEYNKLCGIYKVMFNDGSSVGMKRAWIETGLIPEDIAKDMVESLN